MDLVFKQSENLNEVPYTTSKVIADFSDNSHHAVQQIIKRHIKDLEEFGKLAHEMRPMPSGQKAKVYCLNEQQATLVITYLSNTEPVRQFKKALVKQFYEMKAELIRRGVYRETGKEIRHDLTDAIKEKQLSHHYYILFTNLAYKTALGFTAKQLRQARGVKDKATPLDFLSGDELEAVNKISQQIATLIFFDVPYKVIAERLSKRGVIYQTTLKLPEKAF